MFLPTMIMPYPGGIQLGFFSTLSQTCLEFTNKIDLSILDRADMNDPIGSLALAFSSRPLAI